MSTNKLLEVKNLTVEYSSADQAIHAVNDVSFELKEGQTLGLVGETGAGKTTIAKSILRILPDISSKVRSGEIWLEGRDLMQLSEEEMLQVRGEKISMIFQDPMTALNPVRTIGMQISEGILLHNKISNEEARERAIKILEMVGITEERYDEYPHQFSGGMKQRVVIAMALACNPKLLLADEPTTALDVTIQAQVLELMANLREQLNSSMILITHDLGIVAEMCDCVAIVYAGQIIEYGDKRQIFKNPLHPYTIGLFNALPSMSHKERRLSPIEGLPPDPSDLPKGCKFNPRCPHATDACRQAEIPLVDMGDGHLLRCVKSKNDVTGESNGNLH